MTTQERAQPWSDWRSCEVIPIPRTTLALHPDCLLAWKQLCGCRWKKEGGSQKRNVQKCFISVLSKCYDNFICVSNCVWSCRLLWHWCAQQENKWGSGGRPIVYWINLKRTGGVVKYMICPFPSTMHVQWTRRSVETLDRGIHSLSSFLLGDNVHYKTCLGYQSMLACWF